MLWILSCKEWTYIGHLISWECLLILWENFNVIVLIFKSVHVELKEDVVLIKINHELLTNETFFLTSAGIIELN